MRAGASPARASGAHLRTTDDGPRARGGHARCIISGRSSASGAVRMFNVTSSTKKKIVLTWIFIIFRARVLSKKFSTNFRKGITTKAQTAGTEST
jgi:hypothetical protein